MSQNLSRFPAFNLHISHLSSFSYTQELPARFKKEIVKAAAFQGDKVALDGLSRVLNNIGASNKLSQSEIQSIFSELGSRDDGLIPIQKMEQMI